MLGFLRQKKRSWIIMFLLGLIIVVFIAFYGGSKYQNSPFPDVAQVNGEPVTYREFTVSYERELNRYREMLKGSLTPELMKSLNIKGSVVERLIERKLILQEAKNLGLTVGDDALADAVAKVPDFQLGGQFNKERYVQILRANRLTPAQFEEEQREQLTIQRLFGILSDGVQVTDNEVRDRYRLAQGKVNLQYAKLPLNEFIPQVKLSEEEIKKSYEQNKQSLREPVKLQVEYLSYPFDRFSALVKVSEKEIEEYYQTHRNSKFRKPKQAKARYILVGVSSGADDKAKEEARGRANRILADARDGKDFAKLAQTESDDPTREKGGEIGWISQGQIPPELDNALFALKKGEISNLIETPIGFQIFKMEDLRDEKILDLKESTPEIMQTLTRDKAKREAGKFADEQREKALKGADLNKLAEAENATLNTTRWFSNGEVLPDIGPNQEFYKAAFALTVNALSPIIEGNDGYYILKLKQRQEAAVPPYDKVKEQVEKNLRSTRARDLLLQKANGLLDQLKKEKDFEKLAETAGLKIEETGWFNRAATQVPKLGELPELRAAVWNFSPQSRIAQRVHHQGDSAYIFVFKDSQAADMAEFEKEKDNLKKEAIAEGKQWVLQKFVQGLKQKARIEVKTELLEES